jgi:hypothetical protein
MKVLMDDGKRESGDDVVILSGHNAWIVGDEPFGVNQL